MQQNFPSKKKFTKKFFSEKGKFLFSISYEQATLEEYFEFFAMSEKDRQLTLIEMILEQIPLNFYEKIIQKIFPYYLPKIARKLELESLCLEIITDRFRSYESIFEKIYKKKTTQNTKNDWIWLFSASLSLICEKYHISVLDVIKNLTLEQFLWLQEGVVYSLNTQTEEWQKENSYALAGDKKSSTNWEDIKNQFKNIDV